MAVTRKLLSYSSNLLIYRVYPKNSNPAASFHCHEVNPLLLLVNPQLMKKPKSDLGRLQKLLAKIRKDIGPIAKPDLIHFAPGLPKTRSGKIMRRILRKIAADELDSLGDTSTLADPGVVDELIKTRKNNGDSG